jgi:homoserine O-acetyltransferase
VSEHVISSGDSATCAIFIDNDTTVVETQFFRHGSPFALCEGGELEDLTIAYETYGSLNEARDNAIVLFHAFSGSQHAAGFNPAVPDLLVHWNEHCQLGWWDDFIGPGKALDTDKFFVVCANVLGGCYGTTGPSSLVPSKQHQRYGGSFPWVSARDVVRSQALLLNELGIEALHAVVGASLGGILALTFALEFPERTRSAVPIATSHVVNSAQIASNFAQAEAIHLDPNFGRGDYYTGQNPHHGLVLARQIAQMSFVDQSTIIERAGSEVVNPNRFPSYRMSHPVESYLRGNAARFVDRFDANSYLIMLDLWQRTDFLRLYSRSNYLELFARCRRTPFLVIGIDSDCCFPVAQQFSLYESLRGAGVPADLSVVTSTKGHDSFLLEPELYTRALRSFLGHSSGEC